MQPRYGKYQRDANEDEIVRAFELAGATVHKQDHPTDLLVAFRRLEVGEDGEPFWRWHQILVEIKLPIGPKGGTKDRVLTSAQAVFFERWPEPLRRVVRTPEEARAMIPFQPPRPGDPNG